MKTHEQLVALACFFAVQPGVSRVLLIQVEPPLSLQASTAQPADEKKEIGATGWSPFSFAENGYTIGTTTYPYE